MHSTGIAPARAILGTTMYAAGVIAGPLLIAPIVDRFGMERVLTCGLAFGALCVLSIGLFNPRFLLLSIIIFGAGIAGSCQAGINSLSGLAYTPAMRSTGAGWALGAGRIGTITDPSSVACCCPWAFAPTTCLSPPPSRASSPRF